MSLNHFNNDAEWGRFVEELAKAVKSVDLSLLVTEPMRAKLHAATLGCRRSAMRLLTEITLVSVDSGAASVTEGHVQLAFQRTNGPNHVVASPFRGT